MTVAPELAEGYPRDRGKQETGAEYLVGHRIITAITVVTAGCFSTPGRFHSYRRLLF